MDNLDQVTSVWPVLAIAVFVGVPAFFGWLSARAANKNIEGPTADALARIEARLTALEQKEET